MTPFRWPWLAVVVFGLYATPTYAHEDGVPARGRRVLPGRIPPGVGTAR